MMVELSVFSINNQDFVAVGKATINAKECLALVDLPSFDRAMEALIQHRQPGPRPRILWMERRQDLLAPLDPVSEKVFSEKLAAEVGSWLRVS